ncbi:MULTISPECIES: response regulator transcription factor [Streptomyces]
MSTAPCAHADGGPQGKARASDLRGRLRSLGHEATPMDEAVTTCLLWVAGALLEVAVEVGDARGAGALVHRASAVLAELPPGHPPPPEDAARAACRPEPLTGRQLAVLRHLQQEASLRQIADGLYVSHNTVKSHTRAVYRKLGARSRAEAVHRAQQLGLV